MSERLLRVQTMRRRGLSSKIATWNTKRWKLRTLIVLIILNVLLHISYLSPDTSSTIARGCETLSAEPQLVYKWVSERTRQFFTRWRFHKTRNAAIYACVSTRNVPVIRYLVYILFTCPDVFYEHAYEKLFDVPPVCISHSCLKRFGRSHFVYAEFVLKTFDVITAKKVHPAEPRADGKIAVLLEPRLHPLYEYTVKQVMSALGDTWALQLLVSSENEAFVRSVFDVTEGGWGENIRVTRLEDFGLDTMSVYGNRVQSALSVHEALYKAIPSEHILWFQLDVLMIESPQIEWLEHAYVGSEWKGCQYPNCIPELCPAVCGGGNSGLSLRRRSKLLRIATRGTVPEDLWGVRIRSSSRLATAYEYLDPRAHFVSDELHDNSKDHWFEDDLQISYKLAALGLLPPGGLQSRFAISEAVPRGLCKMPPAGMHKPWSYPWMQPEVVSWLLGHVYAKYFQ